MIGEIKGKCNRVFIIGLDFGGHEIQHNDMPNIQKLLSRGASTYSTTAADTAMSSDLWSRLIETCTQDKPIDTAKIIARYPFLESSFYPPFMKLARLLWPDCPMSTTCMSVGWGPESNFEIDCEMYTKNFLNNVAEFDLKLIYIHFEASEPSGYDFSDPRYEKTIKGRDLGIGAIIRSIDNAGMLDDSVIILCTDYVGSNKIQGKNIPEGQTLLWGCFGPCVRAEIQIEDDFEFTDMVAVVAHCLGLESPEKWEHKIPDFFLLDCTDNDKQREIPGVDSRY